MRISADTIPHSTQRYPTTGDWEFTPDAELRVSVSKMGDWRYESMIAIHEIIEATLCRYDGVEESLVTDFDKFYEDCRGDLVAARLTPGERHPLFVMFGCDCEITEDSEPGDDIHSPYNRQHQLATSVERMLGAEMSVDWNAYEKANNDLYENAKKDER